MVQLDPISEINGYEGSLRWLGSLKGGLRHERAYMDFEAHQRLDEDLC